VKFSGFPVGTGFVSPIGFLSSGIIVESGVFKEIDSQNEVHTFYLVSRSGGHHTNHVKFLRSFSHLEH
jgi:hypothetical protein